MTEAVDEVIERVQKPIHQFVRGWMYGAEPSAYAKTLGLRGWKQFWIVGRAGVIGGATAETAVAALAFHGAPDIHEAWNSLPASLTHEDVAHHFAAQATAWGDRALPVFDEDRLERLDELGRRIIDAAPSSLGAVFAGWRAIEPPASVHARVALTAQVLREMRCAAHICAVTAVGISPLDAVLASTNAPPRTGPGYAERMGFVGPFRDPDEVRPQRLEAEALTSKMMRPFFGVLDEGEAEEFGEIVETTRNAIEM